MSDTEITYKNIDLQNVDLAYIVTQDQLNTAITDWLNAILPEMSFQYMIDEDLMPQPVQNNETPDCTFDGAIAAPIDFDNGANMTIVDMSDPGGQYNVKFTLGFAGLSSQPDGAKFYFNHIGETVTYNQYDAQFKSKTMDIYSSWPVKLSVNLKIKANVAAQGTNAAVQGALKGLQDTYGDVFSISQVLVDLSDGDEVDSGALTPPQNFNVVAWIAFVRCVQKCLQDNAATIFGGKNPTVGYAISQTSQGETPPFTPTDVDVMVQTNSSTPDKGLLIFGMVTTGMLPATWTSDFAGHDDLIPDSSEAVALAKESLITGFLQKQLAGSGYPAAISQIVIPSYAPKVAQIYETFSVGPLIEPAPVTVSVAPTVSDPTIFTANMNKGDAYDKYDDEGTSFDYTYAGTTSTSAAAYKSSTAGWYERISISGTFKVIVVHNSSSGHGNYFSATYWYGWNADFDFNPVADTATVQGIGLTYNSAKSSFPTAATYEDTSTQDPGFEGSSAVVKNAIRSAGDTLCSYISGPLSTAISNSITSMNLFVYPSAGDFNFTSAGLNGSLNLTAIFSYKAE